MAAGLVNSLASKGLEVHGVDFDPREHPPLATTGLFLPTMGMLKTPEYPGNLALSTVKMGGQQHSGA